MTAHAQPDLIFDIGANRGEDTEFYLSKGFRVVAVEANPVLCEQIRARLTPAIAEGRLILNNIGIWTEPRSATFYVNEENDHWSSFDVNYGTRMGTRFRTQEIACHTIGELLARHGTPHYLKIDIEGADRVVLDQLQGQPLLPRYISVEEYGVQALHDLRRLGYRWFQTLGQRDKSWITLPEPPREGRYSARAFTPYDSGPFGAELPGEWLEYAAAEQHFTTKVRAADANYVGPEHDWFDIHAAL